ncbi:MAG: T9SS type A sorting domain-containing protein [Bacteroidota bacterium]
MRFTTTCSFLILTATLQAQNLTNPSWTLAAGGSADSRIKKIHVTDNGSVIALGSFRRGEITFDSYTLSEEPQLDNHFIIKTNSSGQTEWLKGGFNTTYDFETDASGNIIVPSGDTLYMISGNDGSLIWKTSLEPVNGSYLRIYQAELLTNGELVLAGEGYFEDIAAGSFYLDQATTGYYMFTAASDLNGNISRITTYAFNNTPLLNEMQLASNPDNGFYLAFRADEISNDQLSAQAEVENALTTNPSRTAVAAFNEAGTATWAITFKGDSANVHVKEIHPEGSELYVSGNLYSAYGNLSPFSAGAASSSVSANCSGNNFQAFSLVIDTVSKNIISQMDSELGCQGNILGLGFRQYNNADYALLQYQQDITINSSLLLSQPDTSADQQYFYSTALVKYNYNGQPVSATETGAKFGNSFGDLDIQPSGDVVTGGVYMDYQSLAGATPHAVLNKYVNSTTMITENLIMPRVNVYPNPSNGAFSLESDENILSVEIYSTDGSKILANEGESNFMRFDLSAQPAGIYLVKTRTIHSVLKRLVVVER